MWVKPRSGETITSNRRGAQEALQGYREPQPMVFSGLYPIDGDEFNDLRDALKNFASTTPALPISQKLPEL
jgi:GTP-binding protein LepA